MAGRCTKRHVTQRDYPAKRFGAGANTGSQRVAHAGFGIRANNRFTAFGGEQVGQSFVIRAEDRDQPITGRTQMARRRHCHRRAVCQWVSQLVTTKAPALAGGEQNADNWRHSTWQA